jgi:hypothetical protein
MENKMNISQYSLLLKQMAKAKTANELEVVGKRLATFDAADPLVKTLSKYYSDYAEQLKTGRVAF